MTTKIGRRVSAWTGERKGEHGTIVRIAGCAHDIVRWDDGEETWYRAADLMVTDEDHFASPAHDDRGLCRTCRRPIRTTSRSKTAFVHIVNIPPPIADNALVSIDGSVGPGWDQFPAYVDRTQQWNGWLVPHFSRPVAEMVVRWLNRCAEEFPEGSCRAEWDGDAVLITDPIYEAEEPGYVPDRVTPDRQGRYCIGGYSWCWTEVPN
jgi:hypothetical protein